MVLWQAHLALDRKTFYSLFLSTVYWINCYLTVFKGTLSRKFCCAQGNSVLKLLLGICTRTQNAPLELLTKKISNEIEQGAQTTRIFCDFFQDTA